MPGGWEWLIIIVVLVVLFGAKRLPEMARSVGQSARVFKGEMKGMRDDDRPAGASDTRTSDTRAADSRSSDSPPAALPPSTQGTTGGTTAHEAEARPETGRRDTEH